MACGAKPVLADYLISGCPSCTGPRRIDAGPVVYDRVAYNADLAKWNACMAASLGVSSTPSTPSPIATNPNDPNSFATSALAWTSTIGMSATEYNSWHAQIVSALQVGILDPGGQYATQTRKCSGATQPPSNTLALASESLGLAGTAAGVGTTIAGIATSAAPIIGAAVAGGTLLIKLFSKLFGPATSALEGRYLCPLVASVNQVLVQIMAELQNGHATLAQASDAIRSLYTAFHQQLLVPEPLGGQNNALLYYNTPNDSQFFDSSLGALRDYNIAVRYPALAAQGSAVIAQAQAASAAALAAQVNVDVQSALQAQTTQAQTQAPTAPKPVPVQATPVQGPSAPGISTDILIGVAAAAAAAVVILLLV